MNLQQMRCLAELVRQGLRVSATARALSTSQPAVTKQLRQLENELGASLFVREQNRIAALTKVGEQVVSLAREVCLSINAIKRVAADEGRSGAGEIRIATTHAQGRFVLPEPIHAFSSRFPKARFELIHASSAQIGASVAAGEVDLGVTPQANTGTKELRFLIYRTYPRLILVQKQHPILRRKTLSLTTLAGYPIITTSAGLSGRTEVLDVFSDSDIDMNVQLSAPDFDAVKVCIARGLGIAIVPSYTYDAKEDRQIRAIDASSLFPPTVTSIVVRKNHHLPTLVREFLEMLVPGRVSG